MKIISHRGNLEGPNFELENTQEYVDIALENNFDVEIDLWKIKNKFFLGHDEPLNEVSIDWLFKRKNNLWIHTKNTIAFEELLEKNEDFIFFYYAKEPLVLTSNKKIWTHEPKKIIKPYNCIVPLLSKEKVSAISHKNWYGVCTDYPILLSKLKLKT